MKVTYKPLVITTNRLVYIVFFFYLSRLLFCFVFSKIEFLYVALAVSELAL